MTIKVEWSYNILAASPPQFGSDGVQWKVVLIVNSDEFDKSLDSIWCKSVKLAKLNAAEKFQADPEKSSHWDLICAE